MTHAEGTRRLCFALAILFAIAWFWISPWILGTETDGAAWVGLFLLPTGIVAAILGIIGVWRPNRLLAVLLWVVLLLHCFTGIFFNHDFFTFVR